MKSPCASASICTRLIEGLKLQSNSLKGFRSRKCASLMRRSMLRCRRSPAWSANRRCKKSRCDRPASCACFKAASSCSALTGRRKVAKSASTWSRRFGGVGTVVARREVFFGRGFIVGLLRFEQVLVGAGRPGTDRLLPQAGIEQLTLAVGQLLQWRFRPRRGRENASDRCQREGAEAHGALQGRADIVLLVVRQQGQQLLRLQFALDLFGQQAVEELQGHRAQLAEALAEQQLPLARVGGGVVA